MKNLALLMGAIIPEEILIEKLQEALTEHKLFNTTETKSKLGMFCMLFVSKEAADHHGLENIMTEMDQMDKIRDRMNSTKNS